MHRHRAHPSYCFFLGPFSSSWPNPPHFHACRKAAVCWSGPGRACGTRLFAVHSPGAVGQELPAGAAGWGGSSTMLWTSPGSPWGPCSLNPAACSSAGQAAGNICDRDRQNFGPQRLSGQILSTVVSATVSNQQRGRLVRDKVLQRKQWGLFEARAEPSLRGHWLAPGFKWDLLDDSQSRSPGRGETTQSHAEVV